MVQITVVQTKRDMKGSVIPEPAEGLDGVVHIRVRLPNGQRTAVSRRFNGSDDVKVV